MRIIFFDGVCNLCNGSIQLILKNDPRENFHFAPLQSSSAMNYLHQKGYKVRTMESIVLSDNGRIYTRSSAALRIAYRMKGLYPLLVVFFIIPPFIRNAVYDWIARNRYRWFGRKDECMVPNERISRRFVFMESDN